MLPENTVAIITGAVSRHSTGRVTTACFAQHGARVVRPDLDLLAVGKRRASRPGNRRDRPLSVNLAIDKAIDHYGRIDLLVSNAGIMQPVKPL